MKILSEDGKEFFIPSEIWQIIFCSLSSNDLLKIFLVAKAFQEIVDKIFESLLIPIQKEQLKSNPKLTPKLMFFNVDPKDHELLNFILKKKGFLNKEDKIFVKHFSQQINFSYGSLEVENNCRLKEKVFLGFLERPIFFSTLFQNRFFFCREFVEIPAVYNYLFEIAKNNNLTCHVSYLYQSHQLNSQIGNRIGSPLILETLLLSCLLCEVIYLKEGQENCLKFITDNLLFAQNVDPDHLAKANIDECEVISKPGQLYALTRIFVIEKYSTIDFELVKQFYDCYIKYFTDQKLENSELIKTLFDETERISYDLSSRSFISVMP